MASLTDAFVEASPPVLLSAHTAADGTTYTKGAGTGTLGINTSGQLSASASESGIFYYASVVPATTSQLITCSYVITNAGKNGPGIWGYASTDGQDGYHVAYYGGTWYLYRRLSGTYTAVGTWANSATGTFAVEMSLAPNVQSVKIGGTVRITGTDTALSNKGRFGLGAAFDDAGTQIYIASWSAADVVAGGLMRPLPQMLGGMRSLSGGTV